MKWNFPSTPSNLTTRNPSECSELISATWNKNIGYFHFRTHPFVPLMCLCKTRSNLPHMDTPKKELIDRVLAGEASKKEAREVVDWFSSTAEGQAYLSETINHEAHRLEVEGVDEASISPMLSQKMLAEINRQIHQKSIRSMIFRVAAVLIPFGHEVQLQTGRCQT